MLEFYKRSKSKTLTYLQDALRPTMIQREPVPPVEQAPYHQYLQDAAIFVMLDLIA